MIAMFNPNEITYFGESDSRNKRLKFGIKADDRTRHVYVIGKTGMGKSTLLENMAVQDINNGNGMAFIDPHGKTAELLLEYIPEHRIDDVMYFAPFDSDNPISFNVMEDVGEDKRHLVASGLMSTFKKIWVDAWSARMEYILNNAILALLEYPGSTLLSINKMLSDKTYRQKVVDNITDPSVKSYWVDEFANYTERFAAEATPAIQNKIGQFTANPLIRNIIGQPKSSFDMRKMMDERKIVIINLSKGKVGEQNASLLGSMLITKIYLSGMSRADVSPDVLERLPNFYLYVDEFQSFANESFADILSEARKYKLNLTIAHQYVEQMSEEVRSAVFGNVGTFISFRVGSFDAELLEKEFAPVFTAEDLVNLGRFQIYLKLMIDGIGSSPFSATSLPPIAKPEVNSAEQVITASRLNFSKPRAEVELAITDWMSESSRQNQQNKKGNKNNKKQNNNKPKNVREALKVHKNESNKGGSNNKDSKEKHAPFKAALKDELKNLGVTKDVDKKSNEQKKPEENKDQPKPQAVKPEQNQNAQYKPEQKPNNQPGKNNLSNKKKAPSPENVNQLKNALSGILKNVKKGEEKKPAAESKPPEKPQPQKNHQPEKQKSHTKNYQQKTNKKDNSMNDSNKKTIPQDNGLKEVSEDVLRKVLQDENET